MDITEKIKVIMNSYYHKAFRKYCKINTKLEDRIAISDFLEWAEKRLNLKSE